MNKLLKVSSNPHIRSDVSTSSIMITVILALLPAAGFGIYNFGIRALFHIALTVGTAVLTEYLYDVLLKKPITTGDCSAIVTGLLLAMNLPVAAPLWIGVVGKVTTVALPFRSVSIVRRARLLFSCSPAS